MRTTCCMSVRRVPVPAQHGRGMTVMPPARPAHRYAAGRNPLMNRKRGILAATASVTLALAALAQPAQSLPAPEMLAAQAADSAAAAGTLLAKGPDEAFQRTSFTAGGAGLFYSAYQRTYRGLEVIGGDAVVVTDGQGRLHDSTTAKTTAISVDTQATLSAAAASAIARKELSVVERAVQPRLVVFA